MGPGDREVSRGSPVKVTIRQVWHDPSPEIEARFRMGDPNLHTGWAWVEGDEVVDFYDFENSCRPMYGDGPCGGCGDCLLGQALPSDQIRYGYVEDEEVLHGV